MTPPRNPMAWIAAAARLRRMLALFGLVGLLCSCAPRRAVQTPAAPAAGGFPVTMTDALGEPVTVPARPQRIVSLAPAATEMLYALGLEARIVGNTTYCDYPPRARSKAKVGGISNFSVEKVLALRPDLVVAMRINPRDSLAALRQAGVTTFAVDPEDIRGIMAAIETLGRLTGSRQQADAVREQMEQRIAAIRAKVAGLKASQRPTTMFIYGLDPIRVAGGDTFSDDVIETAGGVNLARDVGGFPIYSLEALVVKNPQVILSPSMGKDPLALVRAILARKSLQGVAAVRNKRVYALNADTIDRPGPRIVEGLEEVARALHPDLFAAESR